MSKHKTTVCAVVKAWALITEYGRLEPDPYNDDGPYLFNTRRRAKQEADTYYSDFEIKLKPIKVTLTYEVK